MYLGPRVSAPQPGAALVAALALLALPALLALGACNEAPEGDLFSRTDDDDDDDDDAGDDDDTAGDDDDDNDVGNDDDTVADDDDDDDDDDTGGDDDDTPADCTDLDWTIETPPAIDFGGAVGSMEYRLTVSCLPASNSTTVTAGWVDESQDSLLVSAILTDSPYDNLGELAGHSVSANQAFDFSLTVNQQSQGLVFHAPDGMGELHITAFEENEYFRACVSDHGGVWQEEDGNGSITVPDPLAFVCGIDNAED